ncbi:MAG: hypothetical protein OXM57_02540 [bacterium]|nr:hypothetical protein [bacterium]
MAARLVIVVGLVVALVVAAVIAISRPNTPVWGPDMMDTQFRGVGIFELVVC